MIATFLARPVEVAVIHILRIEFCDWQAGLRSLGHVQRNRMVRTMNCLLHVSGYTIKPKPGRLTPNSDVNSILSRKGSAAFSICGRTSHGYWLEKRKGKSKIDSGRNGEAYLSFGSDPKA